MMAHILCDLWELNIAMLNKNLQTKIQRKLDSEGLRYSDKMMTSFERIS